MTAALILMLALVLGGCAATPEPRVETVTVTEVVFVRPDPPARLLAPLITGDLPAIFVEPDNPAVVLGVTREGLEAFWMAVDRPIDRLRAWRAWAEAE